MQARLLLSAALLALAPAHATMTEAVGNGGIGGFLEDYFNFSGDHFHLGCDDNEVLVGVYGRQGSWVNKIGIRCVDVDARGRWVGNVRSGSDAGGDGDVFTRNIDPTDCPRDTAVVGFGGKYGSYVDRLELECRPLASAEHADGPRSTIGPFGGDGGTEFGPIRCEANRAATGLYGRAGIYVDKLGLKCVHEQIWMPDYHYFPKLESTNESSWMNDPSGLIFQDGIYHLYYQAVTSSARFDPRQVHWDHASSRDLLTWTDHPRVFAPESGLVRGGSPFTGSAVGVPRDDPAAAGASGNDPRCIIALFTRAVPAVRQLQNRAASCNGGRTFSTDVHALSAPAPEIQFHYRDPKVFRFEDPGNPQSPAWVMVLSVGDFVELYKASSLTGPWERTDRVRIFTGAFASGSNPFVETADLMRVPVEGDPNANAWVLTFARGAIPLGTNDDWFGVLTQDVPTPSFYLTGRFNGRRFFADGAPAGAARAAFNHIDIARRLDSGPDFYASQSWHVDGTTSADFATRDPILAAWVNNWNYALFLPTHVWQGQLSIPRTVRLKQTPGGLQLLQQPISDVALLRNPNPPPAWRLQGAVIGESDRFIDLGNEKSYEVLLDLDAGTANRISVVFNDGPNRGSITLHWQRRPGPAGRLHLDRARSFPLPSAPSGFVYNANVNSAEVDLIGNRIQLRVLVDRNSVEVFAEQGQAALTALFYPHPDNDTLRISAAGGEARINALNVYDLDPRFIARSRAIDRRNAARVERNAAKEAAKQAAIKKAQARLRVRKAVEGWVRVNVDLRAVAVWSDRGRPVGSITTQRSGWLVKVPVQVGKRRQNWTFTLDRGLRVTQASADDQARLKR